MLPGKNSEKYTHLNNQMTCLKLCKNTSVSSVQRLRNKTRKEKRNKNNIEKGLNRDMDQRDPRMFPLKNRDVEKWYLQQQKLKLI